MIDCFLIGYNDVDFPSYTESVRAMGERSGAFRDLNLAFINHRGTPYRAMDVLNLLHGEANPGHRTFSNVDFLWPVISYLHTYLTRRGFSVDYINLYQQEKQRLVERLKRGEIRTVAITTTLYVWTGPIVEIIELVRRYSKTTKIIVGGPFIHNQARVFEKKPLLQVLRSLGADIYVISPEGEATLLQVLRALRDGQSLASIPNIVFRDGTQMVQTEEKTENNSLAEEMVDYQQFPSDSYNGFVSVRTAKSCPFACAFCAFPERAGGYTYLPVDLVERELDMIQRVGTVSTISFLDDTFNVPKKRFKELLRMMIRKNYGFRWNSYLRSDHADEEAVELMARSGCEGVFLGIESGSNTILKAMNKTSRREDYMRVIPQLREVGILSHANIIIGFPGETEATVRETISLIETARPDYYRAQLWYCDPTTPVWRQREQLQLKGAAFRWSHPTMDSDAACDWVDRLFREIKGSTWLPQYGFEQWSLYYLQRRGMSRQQLQEFVSKFNAAVLAKLNRSSRHEIDAADFEALKLASQFNGADFYDTRRQPLPDVAACLSVREAGSSVGQMG